MNIAKKAPQKYVQSVQSLHNKKAYTDFIRICLFNAEYDLIRLINIFS